MAMIFLIVLSLWYHQLVFLFRKISNRNSNSLLSWHPSRYTFIINISNMFSDTLLWERVQVVSSVGKESTCKEGDPGSIPGSERSPGEGKCYPLQYSGLENSMDCIVHGVAESQTWLCDFHFISLFALCSLPLTLFLYSTVAISQEPK